MRDNISRKGIRRSMKTNSSQTVRCKRIKPLLSSYVEGELTDDDRLMVESHLKNCDACRKEQMEYRKSLSNLKNAAQVLVPDNLISEFHSRLSSQQSKTRHHGFAWQLGTVGVVVLLAFVFLKVSWRVSPVPQPHHSMQEMNSSRNTNSNKIAMLPKKTDGITQDKSLKSHYTKIPIPMHSSMPIEPRKKTGNHLTTRVAENNTAGLHQTEHKTTLSNTTRQKHHNSNQISALAIATNLSRLEHAKLAQKIAMLNQSHTPFEEDVLPPVKAASPNRPMMTMMSESVQTPVSRAEAPVSKPITANPPSGNIRGMGGFGGAGRPMEGKTLSSKISPIAPTHSMRLQGENIQRVNELIRSIDRVTVLKGERGVNSSGALMWIKVVIETMLTPH